MGNVTIAEVGPRDGFQNVANFIPTGKKAEIINMLVDAGEKQIEFSSFVHPKWIPQLADAGELYTLIKNTPGVAFRALIPNEKGLERAIGSGVQEVIWVLDATDSGNLANLNMTTEQSLELARIIDRRVKENRMKLDGIIAHALGHPKEGDTSVEKVIRIARVFREIGITNITIADSIGIATPQKVRQVVPSLIRALPEVSWGIHLHDILGLGIANSLVAWESGIRVFESSIAGLGGCPYADHPGGNVATEHLVYLFHKLGVDTGIDLDKLIKAREFLLSIVGEHPEKQIGHPSEEC
jgi:hydroxymethylglutaryl-CoA lyase